MNKLELGIKKHKELFGEQTNENEFDSELMTILKRVIFGDIFYIGNLNDKTRELITIVILTAQQALPQLKSHINAALNTGDTPSQIKEAIYQCSPFIGFPKVLNAINIVNEVFKEKNITLPLEESKNIDENERFEKGKEIQFPIYGDEIKEKMKKLPGEFKDVVPRLLTEFCFGDFYTRENLDIKTRELLILCVLVTLGAENQIKAHGLGNIKVGNSKETILSAIVHCIPYIGFPNVINSINIINEL